MTAHYPRMHPDLVELARLKPCRSLGCTEVIGDSLGSDWTVRGVAGFCRSCYARLTEDPLD